MKLAAAPSNTQISRISNAVHLVLLVTVILCSCSSSLPDKDFADNVQISEDTAALYSYTPSIAWSISEFGVVWADRASGNDQIYFQRISAQGERIGGNIRLTTTTADSRRPAITWSGSEYGIVWDDERDGNWEIYFTRLDGAGEKIGDDVRVTNADFSSSYPSITWTESNFALAWRDERDGNYEIYFAQLNSLGSKLDSDVRVTSSDGVSSRPTVVSTGSEFGICWMDDRSSVDQIYFTRLSLTGVKEIEEEMVSEPSDVSQYPHMTWTGTEFAVTWTDFVSGTGDIYFTRVDRDGGKHGGILRITETAENAASPRMVWTSSAIAVVWDYQTTEQATVHFCLLSAEGEISGNIEEISTGRHISGNPRLAMSGNGFGAVWERHDGAEISVIFSAFSPCP